MKTTLSLYEELKRRNVLRVAAAYVMVSWLVIQVVETVFPAFGFGDAAVRIVTIILVIGLIPTFILSWVFEITPEGLKKDEDVDRSQPIAAHAGNKLDRIIMVVMALAIGYFAIDKFVMSESRDTSIAEEARQEGRNEALVESYGDNSIAVLPFVNMSDDASNEYFSDGISEELLNLLAKIPELRVISRSSAFSYKGKQIKLTEVARELNVAHILEGSVRKAGNQVRITVQLIEARTDTHLWSATFDRTLDDIFAIQDEIAAMVVEQLRVTLLGNAPQVEETEPEAYALFLQARYLGNQGSPDGMAQAVELLQQALAIDPEYAGAWRALAIVYVLQAGKALRPADEAYHMAREATVRALAIDPDFAKAYDALGWIAMAYDSDPVQAARHYERALDLAPTDGVIIGNAAALLIDLGRLDEAIVLGEYTAVRDPVNPTSHSNLGISYSFAARYDEAIESFQTALQLSPGHLGSHYNIGLVLLVKGRAEAALAEFAQEQIEHLRTQGQVLAYHDMDRRPDFEARLKELIKRWGDEYPSTVASVYAYTGDADAAFQWLEKSAAEESGGFGPLNPLLKSLHKDPRWLLLLESIGKSPAQLDAIEFEVTLPELNE
jgi:adenylate cyclase